MPFLLGESRRIRRVQGSPVEVHCAWRRVHLSAACSARVTDLESCDDALRNVPKRYTTRAALGQRACGESAPSMSWGGRHHAHCGRPEVRVLGRSEKGAASDIAAQGQREMRRVVGGQWTRKPKATHTEGGPHADAWDARAGDPSPNAAGASEGGQVARE